MMVIYCKLTSDCALMPSAGEASVFPTSDVTRRMRMTLERFGFTRRSISGIFKLPVLGFFYFIISSLTSLFSKSFYFDWVFILITFVHMTCFHWNFFSSNLQTYCIAVTLVVGPFDPDSEGLTTCISYLFSLNHSELYWHCLITIFELEIPEV